MPSNAQSLPSPSPEHRRVAAGQFERANQVVASGDYDYGIGLLISCCTLDPANLIYRQALRRTQKLKYKNNLRGSWLSWLTTARTRAKIRRAMMGKDHLAILELGEQVLSKNPWHVATQMHMANAADALGLLDMAVWILEQARQKSPNDPTLNRALAQLYEKRGKFKQAAELWELIREARPNDMEASSKMKDLAAKETIARGQYESAVTTTAGRHARAEERDRDEEETPRPGGMSKKKNDDKKSSSERGKAPETDPDFLALDRRLVREALALKARIESDPTNANAYLQLAALFRKSGQLDQAKAFLARGVGPTGNNFEIALELADIEIEPFRQNLAITEQRMVDNPDEELRRIRVRLLKEINTRELDLYRLKSDRFPTDTTSRFELGVRLLRAGQIDEAIRELQTTRNDPKWQWKALLYLGHCFKARNNWKLARRNFDEALQNAPSTDESARKEIFFQLAQGCADAGDLQDAVHYASELANLDFGYRDIGDLLDEWQERLQQGA